MVLGVILLGFQNFVRERLGEELWHTVRKDAGIGDRVYLPAQSYPGEDLYALVSSVSRLSGMSTPLVLESFGDTLASDLLRVYGGLLDPKWRMLDVLVHSEQLVEQMAQRIGEIATPSPLAGRWGKDGEVLLVYQSRLKLCALIKGIVRGLGANLEQPVVFEELRCMHAGSTACELSVKLERTQHADRPHGLRRRHTPPAISVAAVRGAMLGARSQTPSAPPPSSGVISTRTSSPSSAPGARSEPPSPLEESSELLRRR